MTYEIQYLDHTEANELQTISEVLVNVNRCSAVVKGGRRFSFSALSVAGNREGIVGYGFGKARQVPPAIEKAAKDARKHLMRVPLTEVGSIPHEVTGRFCGSTIRLVPASSGTGIIATSSSGISARVRFLFSEESNGTSASPWSAGPMRTPRRRRAIGAWWRGRSPGSRSKGPAPWSRRSPDRVCSIESKRCSMTRPRPPPWRAPRCWPRPESRRRR